MIKEIVMYCLKREATLEISKAVSGSSGKTLYKVEIDNNINYWLKLYPEQRKFTQELKAYKLLQEHNTPDCPNLVGYYNTNHYGLLLTDRIGSNCTELALEEGETCNRIFSRAGIFLKQLHQIKPETSDTLAPSKAVEKRFKAIKKANTKSGKIPEELVSKIETMLKRLSNYENVLSRSFCHRDYTPRNWHYKQSEINEQFSVIDFEHSMFDITLLDLAKLNAHYFRKNSKSRDAFYRGYYACSKRPSVDEEEALEILTNFYGLQTLAWGYKYSDEEYIMLGKEALNTILSTNKYFQRMLIPKALKPPKY